MQKTALVTGATSGIGKATAEKLAETGYNLIITGRRENRLDELKKQLIHSYATGVHTLCFDIQNYKAAEEALNSLPQSFQTIDVLVNNAGLAAGLDLFHEGDINDWEQMINTNIKGLLYISRLVAPKMTSRKKGHIINISSIAGQQTYGKGGIYCATKHAVEALTRNMRIDMLPYGIRVSSVSPGAVETEFSEVRLKDKEKAKEVYKGFKPLSAEDIAETVVFVVSRPAHVNINDILIMPAAQADAFHTHREK